jgi:RecA-family ATPase
MKLPPRTTNYIANGAQEGSRNDETFHAACQMRDAGLSEQAAIVELASIARISGLSESEAITSIKSAYRGAKRESLGNRPTNRPNNHQNSWESKRTNKRPKKAKKIEPKPLPEEKVDGIKDLLRTCFKESEWICIGDTFENEDGEHKPTGGTTYKREVLLETLEKRSIQKMFGDPEGIYIRVNPVVEDGKDNKDVTAYRHVLVEFDRDADGNNIPKELQYGAILDSGMPISAVLDSGNKSIHAWIKVDAADKAEYKERVNRVWDHFEHLHLDQQNRNESRYSRCPGVRRRLYDKEGRESGWGKQALLAVNVGAANWSEWEDSHDESGLPQIVDLRTFVKTDFPEPKQLIEGVMNCGTMTGVAAPSKAGKSWILIDLGISIAHGMDWWGFKCMEGRVLYINFELKPRTFQLRVADVAGARGLFNQPDLLNPHNFEVWNLRGYSADISILAPIIIKKIQKQPYEAIIIDPIYKCLGDRDENSAGDMQDFLSHFENISEETGGSVIFAAHYAKGNSQAKDPIDRISGSGVFARHLDTIICVTPWNSKADKTPSEYSDVHVIVREFPKVKKFVVKNGFPLMTRDDKVVQAKDPVREPKYTVHAMLDLLPESGMTATAWAQISKDKLGMSEKTFYRYLKQAHDAKRVSQNEKTDVYCHCH